MAIVAPLPWWRLPFATALAYHSLLNKKCHLCGINHCAPISRTSSLQHHDHWFNHLPYLCQDCHNAISWCNASFEIVLKDCFIKGVASTGYSYPLDQIMLAFKNGQQLQHLPVLVHAIRQLPRPHGCHSKNSLILRVPTSIERLRQRGFDPLAILTKYLSFHWQIPVFNGLARLDRAHQQGLTRDQRLDNIADSFFFVENVPSIKNIILFDDVVTTGATLSEVAKLLKTIHPNCNLMGSAILHG